MFIDQGAGIAAKMPSEQKVAIQEINAQQLRDKLKTLGAVYEWKKP